MARARNIKPGFFKNEQLVELPFEVRLLFIGLWTEADRRGILEDRPKRLKMELFPADNIDVEAGLNLLQASGFIVRYQANTARLIQILKFEKHQNPHKDEKATEHPAYEHGASTVPAPCHPDAAAEAAQPITDSLLPITDSPLLNPSYGKRNEDISCGSDKSKHAPTAYTEGFERFWEAWPKSDRKAGKAECLKRWQKAGLESRADEIVAKVRAWSKTDQWCREGGKFIPMPSTWLQGRYDDDMPTDPQALAKQLIAEKWAKAGAATYIDMEPA